MQTIYDVNERNLSCAEDVKCSNVLTEHKTINMSNSFATRSPLGTHCATFAMNKVQEMFCKEEWLAGD